ncbi:amidohydrolase [Filifactor alocis]
MKILIKNVSCLTMEEPISIKENTNVGIQEGRIAFVGDVPDDFHADEVLDGRDKLLMPGLVNAHTHIAMSLFRNYAEDVAFWPWLTEKILPLEEHLIPEHVYAGSLLSQAEMIRFGITSFADMYFFMDETAKATELSGMRGLLARSVVSGDKQEEKLRESLEFHDNWNGRADGRIMVCSAPHAIYSCNGEYLQQIIHESTKRDMRIHIHLSESKKEVEDCINQYGVSPVEYLKQLGMFDLPTMIAHGVYLSEQDMDILKECHVSVVNNPTSNLKLGNGFAPIHELLTKGVNVALGTDGSASNNNLNLFEEVHLAGILNKGVHLDSTVVPSTDVVKMATINGARAMGLEKVGQITPGWKADMILIDLNQPHFFPRFQLIPSLIYSAQASDVHTVIIDGKIVMKDREILTFDLEKACFECERMAKDLVDRQ